MWGNRPIFTAIYEEWYDIVVQHFFFFLLMPFFCFLKYCLAFEGIFCKPSTDFSVALPRYLAYCTIVIFFISEICNLFEGLLLFLTSKWKRKFYWKTDWLIRFLRFSNLQVHRPRKFNNKTCVILLKIITHISRISTYIYYSNSLGVQLFKYLKRRH